MKGKATFHTKTLQDAIAKNRERLHEVAEGLPVREFKPLAVKPHPRAAEMQAYAAIPSRYS